MLRSYLSKGILMRCLKYLELASVDEQSSKRIAQLKAHCVNAQKALESGKRCISTIARS